MPKIIINKEYGVKLMPPDDDGNQSLGLRAMVDGNPYHLSVTHDLTVSPLFPLGGNNGNLIFPTPEEKEEILAYVKHAEVTNHAVYQYHLDMREKIENAKTVGELKKLIGYKRIGELSYNELTKTYQVVIELNGDKIFIDVSANKNEKVEIKAYLVIEPWDEEDDFESYVDEEPFDLMDNIKALIWHDIANDIKLKKASYKH